VHEGNDLNRVFAEGADGTPASSESCMGNVQTSERAFPTEIELPIFDSSEFGPAGPAARDGAALNPRVRVSVHRLHYRSCQH